MEAEGGTRARNLIVVLADQLRRDALACYGDKHVHTPNIDGLADAGVAFRNSCSTSPICVPFRFSLLTGEYAHSRYVPAIDWRMSPAERTLAHEFGAVGYETVYIGKWHLYGTYGVRPGRSSRETNRTPVPRPYQGGFERWLGFELRNDPWDTCYFVDDDPRPRPIDGYQTDGLFELAIEFISRARDVSRPFFCVLSVEPPHPPYDAPPAFLREWEVRPIELRPNVQSTSEQERARLVEELRRYYAAIENLDWNLGRLLALLGDLGLSDDTVVVFLADHGELGGSHGLREKQYPYEESVGIPLIVFDPAVTRRAEGPIADPTCTEDLYPTLLGLVDLKPHKNVAGMNLTPIIRGHQAHLDRQGVLLEFVAEFRPDMPFYDKTWRGARTERYKYTVLGSGDVGRPWQLFDLQDDPYELNNLVADHGHSAALGRLHGLLQEALERTGDHYRGLAPKTCA